MLLYDADVLYDSPLYTYDGYLISSAALTIKNALYRELKFGVLPDVPVHLDARLTPERAYPYAIFRRITAGENQVLFARERFEVEIVSTDDDELETMRDAILGSFRGRRTFGMYDEDGSPSRAGLRLGASHVSTVDLFDPALKEKAQVLIFLFTYLHGPLQI